MCKLKLQGYHIIPNCCKSCQCKCCTYKRGKCKCWCTNTANAFNTTLTATVHATIFRNLHGVHINASSFTGCIVPLFNCSCCLGCTCCSCKCTCWCYTCCMYNCCKCKGWCTKYCKCTCTSSAFNITLPATVHSKNALTNACMVPTLKRLPSMLAVFCTVLATAV